MCPCAMILSAPEPGCQDSHKRVWEGIRVKFDNNGRRVGAGVVVVQWQNGVPVTVYPTDSAMAKPIWPKQ